MISAVCALGSSVALAALPPQTPQRAEAANLAKAKTAHAGAVGNFQLCQSINSVAMKYKKRVPQILHRVLHHHHSWLQ